MWLEGNFFYFVFVVQWSGSILRKKMILDISYEISQIKVESDKNIFYQLFLNLGYFK